MVKKRKRSYFGLNGTRLQGDKMNEVNFEDDIKHVIMAAYILGQAGANEDALEQIVKLAVDVVRASLIEGVDFDGEAPEEDAYVEAEQE
jgi:hypothetical protein